jgi:hypothetical protein
MGAGKCECTERINGTPCRSGAKWLVQIGARKTDAQLSCGVHLSMACEALYEAEKPRKPALTVTAVRP